MFSLVFFSDEYSPELKISVENVFNMKCMLDSDLKVIVLKSEWLGL